MIPTVQLPIDSSGDGSTITVTFPFADLLGTDTLSPTQVGLLFTSWSPPNQPAVTFGSSPKLSGTNWANTVTIAGAKAGKTFLCYCTAQTAGGQTLTSQVNVLATGVNPVGASSNTIATPFTTFNPMPSVYTPDGWDAGWKDSLKNVKTKPVNVVIIGDSIFNGGNASDLNATSIRALLRSQLTTKYGLYADFFTNYNSSFTGWGNQGPMTAERWGFGYMSIPNGSGGTNTLTFTSPYACTQMDVIYFDDFPGTWSYNLDGAGNTTITNLNNNASSASSCVKRITLSGLSNTTHTLVFASQSASFTCAILGVICYPQGTSGGGIAFAPLTYAGTLLTDKINTYALNAPVPQDMTWLFQGANPLGFNPGTPPSAITAGTPTAGGSVDVGTHYYAITYYGGFGETTVGSSTSAAVTVSGGNQTVPLSAIPNSALQSNCPYNASANKNLYRTKASGTGTPGSGTNPFYFLAKVANGTTTYTDTTADSALTNQQPPATQFTWTPAGAFGFPTAPNLAIIAMGANDIAFNYSATNVSNYELTLKRLVRAIRRGRPGASILIFAVFVPDGFNSDGGSWASGNSTCWSQYVDMMYRVAQAENCGLINNDARWQCNALANGFIINDVHPTDAGNADELVPIVAALGL